MKLWFRRLVYSRHIHHHFRMQILSIVMLLVSVYASRGRGKKSGITIVFDIGVYYHALKFWFFLHSLYHFHICPFENYVRSRSEYIPLPEGRGQSRWMSCKIWMIHFGTKLLQSLVHPPTPGTAAYRHGWLVITKILEILEIKSRSVLFDLNSLKNTAL